MSFTELSQVHILKQTSPKAANIHNRRLRSLRSLHQRLWMFALFEDALASDKVKRGDVLASNKVERGDVLV